MLGNDLSCAGILYTVRATCLLVFMSKMLMFTNAPDVVVEQSLNTVVKAATVIACTEPRQDRMIESGCIR